jgi:hypothetical protein
MSPKICASVELLDTRLLLFHTDKRRRNEKTVSLQHSCLPFIFVLHTDRFNFCVFSISHKNFCRRHEIESIEENFPTKHRSLCYFLIFKYLLFHHVLCNLSNCNFDIISHGSSVESIEPRPIALRHHDGLDAARWDSGVTSRPGPLRGPLEGRHQITGYRRTLGPVASFSSTRMMDPIQSFAPDSRSVRLLTRDTRPLTAISNKFR